MKINFAEVRSSPEYTSALIRYAIWFLSTLLIGLGIVGDYYEASLVEYYIYFAIGFFTYTTVVFISILFVPYISFRPYLTIPFDVAAICISMLFTDDGPFSPFFLLFPWYFVSYSIRYGRGPLFAAAVVSLIAFGIVLYKPIPGVTISQMS